MEGNWVQAIPAAWIYRVAGLLGTALLALAGYVMQRVFKSASERIAKFEAEQSTIKDELVIQRTNHLSHIQTGIETMVSEQQRANLELAKQTGALTTLISVMEKK